MALWCEPTRIMNRFVEPITFDVGWMVAITTIFENIFTFPVQINWIFISHSYNFLNSRLRRLGHVTMALNGSLRNYDVMDKKTYLESINNENKWNQCCKWLFCVACYILKWVPLIRSGLVSFNQSDKRISDPELEMIHLLQQWWYKVFLSKRQPTSETRDILDRYPFLWFSVTHELWLKLFCGPFPYNSRPWSFQKPKSDQLIRWWLKAVHKISDT